MNTRQHDNMATRRSAYTRECVHSNNCKIANVLSTDRLGACAYGYFTKNRSGAFAYLVFIVRNPPQNAQRMRTPIIFQYDNGNDDHNVYNDDGDDYDDDDHHHHDDDKDVYAGDDGDGDDDDSDDGADKDDDGHDNYYEVEELEE